MAAGPPLSDEQRRALAMLATTGRDGTTRSLLTALGSGASLINSLVNQKLATVTHEKIRAPGKIVDVAKVRITNAGRRALEE